MADAENNDFADNIIDILEPQISEKYNISLKMLLTDPLSIENKKDTIEKITDIKTDINSYIDTLISESSEKESELNKLLENINDVSLKLDAFIKKNATEKNIPVLKAIYSRNTKKDKIINIENFEENVTLLVNKLLSASLFVIDESYKYKEYDVGAWIFSSNNDYAIEVFLPPQELMIIESARIELNNLIDQTNAILSDQVQNST